MKPLDLDRKHLDVRHLGVEELHDAGEWVRNEIRHEQQPQALRREVRGNVLPELVRVGVAIRLQQGRELGVRIAASCFGLALEHVTQLIPRPGLRGVRRVLQELPDNRAANLRV